MVEMEKITDKMIEDMLKPICMDFITSMERTKEQFIEKFGQELNDPSDIYLSVDATTGRKYYLHGDGDGNIFVVEEDDQKWVNLSELSYDFIVSIISGLDLSRTVFLPRFFEEEEDEDLLTF